MQISLKIFLLSELFFSWRTHANTLTFLFAHVLQPVPSIKLNRKVREETLLCCSVSTPPSTNKYLCRILQTRCLPSLVTCFSERCTDKEIPQTHLTQDIKEGRRINTNYPIICEMIAEVSNIAMFDAANATLTPADCIEVSLCLWSSYWASCS